MERPPEPAHLGLRPEPSYKRWLKGLVYELGSLHTVGPRNALEGVEICRALGRYEIPTTLGQFGRVGDDPRQTVQEYQLASASLAGVAHYLSLKPPVLQFDLRHTTAIASTALSNGHAVLFDAHGYHLAEPTLRLLEQLMRQDLPDRDGDGSWRFGLALPARWKRSLGDARWAVARGVRPRVVKGEFRASSRHDEVDPREGFIALVDRLAGSVPELAVGTHDRDLAREAIHRCGEAGCAVELELLFGFPAPDMIALAREMAVPVRFYVPFGETLLVYGIRHLLAHPHKLLRPGSGELLAGHHAKLASIIALSTAKVV